MVLAGGEGKRLWPLTADRAKPAVPFGGNYRLIDFALSNLVNGGFLRIAVLTQYKSHSLDRHIATTWQLSTLFGNYVAPVPAQMRRGPALVRRLRRRDLPEPQPDRRREPRTCICVFGADHVYRIDPRQMVAQHVESGAGVTVAGLRVPIEQARPVRRDGARRRRARRSRPSARSRRTRSGCRTTPDQVVVLDGQLRLRREGARSTPSPRTRRTRPRATTSAATSSRCWSSAGEAQVFDFASHAVPGVSEREHGYWRDIGTLDAYYDAHMDLISPDPIFNLYNARLADPQAARAGCRRRSSSSRSPAAPGMAIDSMVCAGVDRLGRRRCGARCSRRASACTRAPRSRARCCCTASTSAQRRGRAQRDRRQERA